MPKEYKVIGRYSIFGYAPGQTFTMYMTEFDEDRLVAGGGLEVVKQPTKGTEATKQSSQASSTGSGTETPGSTSPGDAGKEK